MSVTAQAILDRARSQLIDTAATQRWTDAELLRWLSDGLRTIVAIAPSATSTTAVRSLAAGTRQTIPTDGHMLLTIVRNTNAAGTTAGRAARIVSRELLDANDPDWHTATLASAAHNYVFDPSEPTVFYVYPPNDGTGYVQLVYSKTPTEITSGATNIPVQDIYSTALVDYVLFRAHQKDSDFAAGQAVAQGYLQLFMAFVAGGESAQLAANPNLQLPPQDNSTKGVAK